MNKKLKNSILSVLIFLLCVLLGCIKITGERVHVMLGIVLILVTIIHIRKNKERMKYVPLFIKRVNQILVCTIVMMFVSGFLLQIQIDFLIIQVLHKLCAMVFILGCMIHIAQHKKTRKIRY